MASCRHQFLVEHNDQGGLLDVAIDPDFTRTKLVYLSFTEAAERTRGSCPIPGWGSSSIRTTRCSKGTAVARGRLDGDELKDLSVIWRQEPKIVGLNHFGGRARPAPPETHRPWRHRGVDEKGLIPR